MVPVLHFAIISIPGISFNHCSPCQVQFLHTQATFLKFYGWLENRNLVDHNPMFLEHATPKPQKRSSIEYVLKSIYVEEKKSANS